jgi:hypothetical protein
MLCRIDPTSLEELRKSLSNRSRITNEERFIESIPLLVIHLSSRALVKKQISLDGELIRAGER